MKIKFRIPRWPAALALLLIPLVLTLVGAEHTGHRPLAAAGTKKLVVLIVIDQFRADYLSRFNHLFGPNGFKRLITRGAYFTNANYPYANTFTAVGHSTIVSGSIPAIHGMIANRWYDREAGAIKEVMSDPMVHGMGTEQTSSPWRLLSTTLGDQLRLSNNYQSKTIGISLKDRAAEIMAGRRGSAAYWFDVESGAMVSSSYFLDALPEWVVRYNEQHFADQYFRRRWERKLPEAAYKISDRDDAPYEDTWPGNTTAFPHLIDGNQPKITSDYYRQFEGTPFANEFLAKFSATALERERLGQGQYTDMLAISFSAPDIAGHMFGPYSQELEDMVVRLDDVLSTLLDTIDRQVGLDNTLIVLTADHGVAPIPGYSQAHGLGGMRIIGRDLRARVEAALRARYGDGNYILALVNQQFYLNEELLQERNLNVAEVEEFVGREALKTAGVADYFTRTRLLMGESPNTDIGRRIMTGFHPKRSGNVWLLVEPFTLIAEGSDELQGTAHGTPYQYDTHVPIIIAGREIKAGIYRAPCSPTDIAPTLCALLGVEPPSGSVGRVLTEAIRGQESGIRDQGED